MASISPPLLIMPRVLSALLYGACSASMAFANKAVMSSYEFNFPFAIMAIQMVASILALHLLALVSRARNASWGRPPPYTLERAKLFALPSTFSALHSSLSLVALHGMNIPMYVALKRCTPAVNLVLACLVLKKPFPSNVIILAIGLITLGCLIAGFGDLTFDALAYTVGSLSVLVQGLYQTYIQKAAEQNMSVLEIFQLNCYNCLPMFLLGSIATSEPLKIINFQNFTDSGFIMCLATVIVLGSVMNYSLFLCTSLNSALTTSLIGVFKSVLQTIVGFFTFGGVPYDPVNISGLGLNTFGGFAYTYAKWVEHKRGFRSTDQKQATETDKDPKRASFDVLIHRNIKEQKKDKLESGV